MNKIFTYCVLFTSLLTIKAHAQERHNRWLWAPLAGPQLLHVDASPSPGGLNLGFQGGIVGGFYADKPRLSLLASAFVEGRRIDAPWFVARPQWLPYVVFPVYLRTGLYGSRVNLLLGYAWAMRLGRAEIEMANLNANWRYEPKEEFAMLGLEARLWHDEQHLLTLSGVYRLPNRLPMFKGQTRAYGRDALSTSAYYFSVAYYFSSK